MVASSRALNYLLGRFDSLNIESLLRATPIDYQRHCPRWRFGYAPLSGNARHFQAVAAAVRQTAGLLPARHAHVGGNPRHSADLDGRGWAVVLAPSRWRLALGQKRELRHSGGAAW